MVSDTDTGYNMLDAVVHNTFTLVYVKRNYDFASSLHLSQGAFRDSLN